MIPSDGAPAVGAFGRFRPNPFLPYDFHVFIENETAVFALQKRLSPLYGKKRYKKKAQVLVGSLLEQPHMTAVKADPGMRIQGLRFRLDSADKKEHLISSQFQS